MLRSASRADEKRISLRAVRPSREALRRDRAIALAEAGGPTALRKLAVTASDESRYNVQGLRGFVWVSSDGKTV